MSEFIDGYWVRCPKCGTKEASCDIDGMNEDGDHDVACGECGHEYIVNTMVSIDFCSPAMLEPK